MDTAIPKGKLLLLEVRFVCMVIYGLPFTGCIVIKLVSNSSSYERVVLTHSFRSLPNKVYTITVSLGADIQHSEYNFLLMFFNYCTTMFLITESVT